MTDIVEEIQNLEIKKEELENTLKHFDCPVTQSELEEVEEDLAELIEDHDFELDVNTRLINKGVI